MNEAQERHLVNRIIIFANIGISLNKDVGLAGKDWLMMFLK